jgi:hypothetical protein
MSAGSMRMRSPRLRVGRQAMGVAEPGPPGADAPGVGELRLSHLPGQVLANGRLGLAGEVVRRLGQHHLPDGHQLVQLVAGKVDMMRDPPSSCPD